MLDQGMDANTPLDMVSGEPHNVEQDNYLLISLTALRKRGARFPQDILGHFRESQCDNTIRTLIEWGYDPNPLTIYGCPLPSDSLYGRLAEEVKRLRWDIHLHQQLTTPIHTTTVETMLMIWNFGNSSLFTLIPREVLYMILSEVYEVTHPLTK